MPVPPMPPVPAVPVQAPQMQSQQMQASLPLVLQSDIWQHECIDFAGAAAANAAYATSAASTADTAHDAGAIPYPSCSRNSARAGPAIRREAWWSGTG